MLSTIRLARGRISTIHCYEVNNQFSHDFASILWHSVCIIVFAPGAYFVYAPATECIFRVWTCHVKYQVPRTPASYLGEPLSFDICIFAKWPIVAKEVAWIYTVPRVHIIFVPWDWLRCTTMLRSNGYPNVFQKYFIGLWVSSMPLKSTQRTRCLDTAQSPANINPRFADGSGLQAYRVQTGLDIHVSTITLVKI
jgi:hypothetical protein